MKTQSHWGGGGILIFFLESKTGEITNFHFLLGGGGYNNTAVWVWVERHAAGNEEVNRCRIRDKHAEFIACG